MSSVLNAVFQNLNMDQPLLNQFYNIGNHPVINLEAGEATAEERIAAIGRLSSMLYLTRPPLIWNSKLTYTGNGLSTNQTGRIGFGRMNELTNYNPLWSRVNFVVFVLFSGYNTGSPGFEQEKSFWNANFDTGWYLLANGQYEDTPDYASIPKKHHILWVGAEQSEFTAEQKATLEEACAPPPTPLLVKLFPYIFG